MSSSKLRFDGWVLDPESGDLERGEARIRLQEQPVQVLRELIAHAGSVVPREQLIALLWPKGVVDFDTGLNTVVRKLRSALGDTSETPRYIETLPRRGYRFIGILDPDPKAASGPSAAMPVSTPSRASLGPASALHQEPTVPPEAGLAAPRPMASEHEPAARDEATSSTAMTIAPVRRPRLTAMALIAALAVAALLTGVYALWRARSGASVTGVRVEAPSQSGLPASVAPTSAVAFSPPPHSIAVLPFVNMSGDPSQEYFSDGLTEELLNSLSRIDGLQVAARTSSFSFQGEHPDIATVAHKLNVASVLEGSVRRSGHTIRVTARLDNAVTGYHLWSQSYDRDLGDVLKLQTEIATAVASALEVTLLGDVGAKIELGGTRNPGAFDAYLRASKAFEIAHDAKEHAAAIAAYDEAIQLDPNYALAFAARSYALTRYAGEFATGAAVRDSFDKAQADARQAIALAPELAEGHLARAGLLQHDFDYAQADEELARAVGLAPGNSRVLAIYGMYAVVMGHTDAGLAAIRRAVALDPLNRDSHYKAGQALYFARRYAESAVAWSDVLALDPQTPAAHGARGIAYYALGDLQAARASCEARLDDYVSQQCLALVYNRIARQADAEAALAKLKADRHGRAYRPAEIYAQWGNTPQALELLETALRLRDQDLRWLKADPLMDPLRNEPRFQAVERKLKFPE